MSKKTKKSPPKQYSNLDKIAKRYKHIALAILLVAIISSIFVFNNGSSGQKKFSDKDYAALAAEAQRIFTKAGGKDLARNEFCGYSAPEKYANDRLYCTVEVAAYLPYKSDEHAISVVKRIESEMRTIGSLSSYLARFYHQPSNGQGVAFVNLESPFPEEQCNLTVYSNDKAKDAIHYVPPKLDDGLIALHFSCNPESRGEYFPVRDR